MKIATFVNQEGHVAGLYESGLVRLYNQSSGVWTKEKEFPLELSRDMGLAEVRVKLRNMVSQLEDCHIFLAGEVKGVPYAILEGMDFNIWKSQGPVVEQLDFVAAKEQEAIEAAKKPKPEPLPVGDIRDCIFQINLQEVLASDPSLTSKSVLLPFLKNTAFQKLEILCEHAPRWLSSECESLGLRAEGDATGSCGCGHEVKITVYPKD